MKIEALTVAICTFQRASLSDTLLSLVGQANGEVVMQVVVIDNDDVPSAYNLVERLRAQLDYSLSYLHVPGRNISIARNAGLSAAGNGWMVFVDDDETCPQGWLSALIDEAQATDAAAVFGPVQAIYPANCAAWLREGDFHSVSVVDINGTIITGYSCNVLMNLDHPAISGRHFDLALGQSGGEDTVFFADVFNAGGKLAFAPKAILHEIATPLRLDLRWLWTRRYRSGQTHARLVLQNQAKYPGHAVQIGLMGAKVIWCMMAALISCRSAVGWRSAALRGALHLGSLTRMLGGKDLTLYGTSPNATRI